MDLRVFPIPIPPPTSLSTRSLWVFPVHQAQALVSFIQPGLVVCFTLDNVYDSMLFSENIPPSPSPTESSFFTLFFHFHQEALSFFFTFCHKSGVIWISEVIDMFAGNLDSSLCFFQPRVSHDVLCIQVK